MEITDAYAHCGLRKYKPVEDLRAAMAKGGVSRAVLAQHRGEFDHRYIEDLVRRYPTIFRGMFLVDMTSPGAMDEITHWAGRGYFRGIRMAAETLATGRALWDWAATLGLHFVVDGDVAAMVEPLGQFAEDHPRSALVFTHMAQPRGGHERFLELSSRKNVHVQISGMHQFGKLPYEELKPWISKLHEAFGADRLLYASNFPVMESVEVYVEEIRLLSEGRLGVPKRDAEAVMNANALRVWFAGQRK